MSQVQRGPVDSFPELAGKAEQLASNLLDEVWEERKFPVDPYQVAARRGVEVYTAQIEGTVSGILLKKAGEPAGIYVDVDDVPARRRFTVAHELGHLMAHEYAMRKEGKDPSDEPFSRVEYRGETATLGADRDEVFANGFAAALLMPRRDVVRLAQVPGLSVQQMARYFWVSTTAMSNRLSNLGLRR